MALVEFAGLAIGLVVNVFMPTAECSDVATMGQALDLLVRVGREIDTSKTPEKGREDAVLKVTSAYSLGVWTLNTIV